jgi:hypothetical protein
MVNFLSYVAKLILPEAKLAYFRLCHESLRIPLIKELYIFANIITKFWKNYHTSNSIFREFAIIYHDFHQTGSIESNRKHAITWLKCLNTKMAAAESIRSVLKSIPLFHKPKSRFSRNTPEFVVPIRPLNSFNLQPESSVTSKTLLTLSRKTINHKFNRIFVFFQQKNPKTYFSPPLCIKKQTIFVSS